jgi:hypothetical protein
VDGRIGAILQLLGFGQNFLNGLGNRMRALIRKPEGKGTLGTCNRKFEDKVRSGPREPIMCELNTYVAEQVPWRLT